MSHSNGTTPFLIQFALDLNYFLSDRNLEDGFDADESMWLMDTLITALDHFAEDALHGVTKQDALKSPYFTLGYAGATYDQAKELKDLIIRSYQKYATQSSYDYFKVAYTGIPPHVKTPMDDRSDAVVMTPAPDSWFD